MMKKKLTLAYSTCPNDTFLFYALAHKKIDLRGLKFKIIMDDVESLNKAARKEKYHITKLSFAALGSLVETYGLLRSGAALGRGCGPLIVAKPGFDISGLAKTQIAVPGLGTTASMLLGLYLEKIPDMAPMVFDRIMPEISRGKFKAGVIIHEGRFTFENYGLKCLVDLGEWWEKKTNFPIPLGGIAISRKLGPELAKKVENIIHDSVIHAFSNPKEADAYIREHAKETAPDVIKQHIELYVNDFTASLGNEGELAIKKLYSMARKAKLIGKSHMPVFAC